MSEPQFIETGVEGQVLLFQGQQPGNLMFYASGPKLILSLHPDGTMAIGPEFKPDEAAKEFLNVLAEFWPHYVRKP